MAAALSWAGRVVLNGTPPDGAPAGPSGVVGTPVVRSLDAHALASLRLAPRAISPFDPDDALALLRAAAADGARVVGAVAGDALVGGRSRSLRTVRPARRHSLPSGSSHRPAAPASGGRCCRRSSTGVRAGATIRAHVGVAERDVVEPLDVAVRIDLATRLLRSVGFELVPVSPDVRRDDPWAIAAVLRPG